MKRNPSCWPVTRVRPHTLVIMLAVGLLSSPAARAANFSGTVSDGGLGLSGIRINYSWSSPVASGSGHVTSGSGGSWSSSGWGPLTTVTFVPSQAGYSWSPPSRKFSTDVFGGGSASGQNFGRISYTISGTVRVGGVGVGGVRVTLSGQLSEATTTSSSGAYSFTRLRTGSYTVTPSFPGYSFGPASRTVSLSPTRTGQDFDITIPLATTLAADGIGFGNATLHGSVIGDGTLPTDVWFEYGQGTNFDLSTPVETLPAGGGSVPVSAGVTHISGGINYYFRLVAANTNGTNVAASAVFRMPFPAAGTAVSFDGINDYVQVGSDPKLKMTTNLTVEAWIEPAANPAGATIVNREGEYELRRNQNGTLYYALANSTPGWVSVSTGVTVPTGDWTHVALTYDATAPTNQVNLYTNGVLAYSGQATGAIGDAATSQNDLRIGGRQAGGSFWAGQIDEVRIWNVTRTASDIQNNFQRRLTGSESGPVAYFKFDEGMGTTAADTGPNGFVATLTSGASFVVSGAVVRDPVVDTQPAVPVLATTATLRGVVNPCDAATSVYFEYGPSLAFGQTTVPQMNITGLSNVPVSAVITNLEPGTSYFFRLVANNSFGTTIGQAQTFTTLVLGCGWPISTKVTAGQAWAPKHVVAPDGGTYVAGLFTGSATFSSTLTAGGGSATNAFIGKLARGADWLWATNVQLSAGGSIHINALALDHATNICIAGQFSGTATFGTNVLTAVGGTDLFVAKLGPYGTNWFWATSVGDTGADSANALALGPSGNIYIAGQFTRTNVFGPSMIISSNNTPDVFVAKMDPNGNWLWASSAPANGANDAAHALVVDANENVYLAGEFGGTAIFGGAVLNSVGNQDLFVAKADASGNWLLARRGGGANNDVATALAVDAANQIYLLGRFDGTADYAGSLNNLNLGGGANLFVAKLNSSANVLWYAQGGSGFAESITPDGSGHVYITGDFPFATTFGATSLTTSGNSDVFIAQLSADNGAWNWAQKIGSTGNEFHGSIGVDASGGVVVSGSYQNTIQIGYVLLTSPNDSDIFVARLGPDGVYEHNTFVIGEAVPVPADALDPNRDDGGAWGQPTITILEKQQSDSDALNSFVWSIAEHKLYPVRPVTAVLKWPLTADATNTVLVDTCVGRSVFPAHPQYHVANAPVDLEPAIPDFHYKFLNLAFSTVPGAAVDATTKRFTATQPGWSVIQFYDTSSGSLNPAEDPAQFEVVRTLAWNDPTLLVDNQPAEIGKPLQNLLHSDPTGKNGFVYFENSFYDGAGDDRAYDRATRTGPIIPVNKDTVATNDDLVVVWYRQSPATGIPWPSLPVRYVAQWPANPDELVLASGLGSGVLDPALYPSKRVYRQPDKTLPGYNPNEEHAALYGDTLYALRNDLNAVMNASEPYTLLKYQDPATMTWTMKVFKIVSTNATYSFMYPGEAGQTLFLPAPLSSLGLCGLSNYVVSGPGFQDHLGQLYARAAGPNNTSTNIVARYFYPLQPDFDYDFNGDGQPDVPVGTCIPWLDRRPGGVVGVPRDVTYVVNWPAQVPTLQIGETLLGAKFGLPDLANFASAALVFDEGNPTGTNAASSLVRLFDPLSERTLQLATNFALPPEIATANVGGREAFSDLPYFIRSRLLYDDQNKRLSFGGLLNDSAEYGGAQDPLLLINVLSPRERDRIKQLSTDSDFQQAIDDLYDLTRNPNRIDQDGDGQPDQQLLIGLTAPNLDTNLNVRTGPLQPEKLGNGPKALTAGPGNGTGYVTVVENDDPALTGLPITLHIIRVEGGPYRGDIKVINPDDVFDQKLTLRHSADFGGEPQRFEFQWYYHPDETGFDSTDLPVVATNGDVTDLRGWTRFPAVPSGVNGYNDITIGDGGQASILTLADNWFICRYRGYVVDGQTNWSDWVGAIGGGQAQLAEGWVKRVVFGLNPFEARTAAFHENAAVTFASMLQQAGPRYEGDIAFNPAADNINNIGLIQAYSTVLHRAEQLSIDAVPGINYEPANNALLLAAGRIADFYMLLGNEAYADAADPTIGFRTDSAGYGALAPSIFAFQNQVDSLLEEEITLLRGRDDTSATVRSAPVYNRLFWNFTHDQGEVAYVQTYNITDQNNDGFINADDAQIMFPQGHGDAWGHYLTATTTYYDLLRNTNFDWVPRAESILLAGVPVTVDYLDERKFASAAAAKANTGAEIVGLTYRLNYVDDPAGQYEGYKDTDPSRAWGMSGWAHRAGSGAFFDWVTANAILPATDPNTNHTGIQKIDRTTVPEIAEIASGYDAVQAQIDKADGGLNPLGLAKNALPFDIDPSQIDAGKTHFEQIYDRAIQAMNNTVTVFNNANQLSQSLRALQDNVNTFSQNVDQQERDYKNRMIEIFGYPYAGDIGAGQTYPSGYDGPDIYHYMYVNAVDLNGDTAPPSESFTAYFSPMSTLSTSVQHYFPDDAPGLENTTLDTANILQVSYPKTASDFGFVAPASWGTRRAPGEIQMALSDLLQSQARLTQALINYDNLIKQIGDQIDLLSGAVQSSRGHHPDTRHRQEYGHHAEGCSGRFHSS